MYYNADLNSFFSTGELCAIFGTLPAPSELERLGYLPYVDPLEESSLYPQNARNWLQRAGIAIQDKSWVQSYILTPMAVGVLNQVSVAPTGQISFFASEQVPLGYLLCDGSTHLISDYIALGLMLGDLYGGDGITTFAVPDLRGQFIRGWDNGAGVDPGRAFGSNQGDAFGTHSHLMAGNLGAAGSRIVAGTTGKEPDYTSGAPTQFTGDTETRPKNVALLPCIFSGVFTTPAPGGGGSVAE
jgi:microcystin-dependent protein